jgi:L-serine dehydratase
MKAAKNFGSSLDENNKITFVDRIQVKLYGSLGATGKGHGTGPAVLLGLEAYEPETVDPDYLKQRSDEIIDSQQLLLDNKVSIIFNPKNDLHYIREKSLPEHANGMVFSAYDRDQILLLESTYYSIGGGFVVQKNNDGEIRIAEESTQLPFEFNSASELLALCEKNQLSIAELMLANEKSWRNEEEIKKDILNIWHVMKSCVEKGITTDGILPGGLKVKRRAPSLFESLNNRTQMDLITPNLRALDWVNLYALAVNEENAAGGRVVTAPTNGAAGIIPAVLHYYINFCPNSNEKGVIDFLLTAAAIGILFKKNASISGAEVGCQGEVGSACAMAAAGLAQVTGGTPQQVENAAEIGVEHNLGLTCDPVGGLVQVPCIERNAMASVKAINAASMALRGDGQHFISLDKAIHTMRETGKDMLDKYKETSRGGLAVNIVEC